MRKFFAKKFLKLKHFFTQHDENLLFVSNIHGDAIEMSRGKRSVWECPSCGVYIWKDKLFELDPSKTMPIGDINHPTDKAVYRRANGQIFLKLNNEYHVQGKLSNDGKHWLCHGVADKLNPNELVELIQ